MEVFFLTDNRQLKDFFAEKIVLKTIPLDKNLIGPQAGYRSDDCPDATDDVIA